MVRRKKKKYKLYWIIFVVALILLVILSCFIVLKKFIVDSDQIGDVFGENNNSWTDSQAPGEVIDSDGVINAIDGGSSDGSDGGGDSGASDGGEVAPPRIPMK